VHILNLGKAFQGGLDFDIEVASFTQFLRQKTNAPPPPPYPCPPQNVVKHPKTSAQPATRYTDLMDGFDIRSVEGTPQRAS
jgi:hypothetical protein